MRTKREGTGTSLFSRRAGVRLSLAITPLLALVLGMALLGGAVINVSAATNNGGVRSAVPDAAHPSRDDDADLFDDLDDDRLDDGDGDGNFGDANELGGSSHGGGSPGGSSHGGGSPGGTSPGGTSPGGTSPGGTSPGGTSPGGTSPGGTSPGGTSPGGTSPPPPPPPPLAPVGTADIMVIKADAVDAVQAGADLRYVVTVRNLGPATATDVVLIDFIPDGVSFISASASQGSCSDATCNLGAIPAGGSATVDILVRVDDETSGTITNTACAASGSTSDVNLDNNCDSEETTVPGVLPAAVLPEVVPPTGGDPGTSAGGSAAMILSLSGLTLAGLGLMGGGTWGIARLRRRQVH